MLTPEEAVARAIWNGWLYQFGETIQREGRFKRPTVADAKFIAHLAIKAYEAEQMREGSATVEELRRSSPLRPLPKPPGGE